MKNSNREVAMACRAIAANFEKIAEVLDEPGSVPVPVSTPSGAIHRALNDLTPRHRGVVARVASSVDIAEDTKGLLCRWLALDEATAGYAKTPKGSKRLVTTIRTSAEVLAGVGWTVQDGEVLVRVPEEVAVAARAIAAREDFFEPGEDA